MYEIHAKAVIAAPLQRVFDAVCDHEHFFQGPSMTCRLVTPGREHRNGLGAVREVAAEGSVFTEEVTAFDPPRRIEYVIRKVVDARGKPVGIKHDGGWIDFSPVGDATQVVWRSRFKLSPPVLGWILERWIGPRAARGFAGLLQQAKAKLETKAGQSVRV